MEGKIGGLFKDNKQVGGFLDWKLDIPMSEMVKGDSKEFQFTKWKIEAQSYWTFEACNEVEVRLLINNANAYWSGNGVMEGEILNERDRIINQPLFILGEGILEACEI